MGKVHFPHGREDNGTKIDMDAESYTSRFLDRKKRGAHWAWIVFLKSESLSPCTNFFQGYTYPNNPTPLIPLKDLHSLSI